jgi:hypothetical protein
LLKHPDNINADGVVWFNQWYGIPNLPYLVARTTLPVLVATQLRPPVKRWPLLF